MILISPRVLSLCATRPTSPNYGLAGAGSTRNLTQRVEKQVHSQDPTLRTPSRKNASRMLQKEPRERKQWSTGAEAEEVMVGIPTNGTSSRNQPLSRSQVPSASSPLQRRRVLSRELLKQQQNRQLQQHSILSRRDPAPHRA